MKHPIRTTEDLADLRFDERGLVPVIAQDEATGAVLMLAWADRAALEASLATGLMTYWSRSRGRPWQKGEESGHVQRVVALAADCDRDALLAVVDQEGPACHEGTGTCWSRGDQATVATFLGVLDRLVAGRRDRPGKGYTDRLLADEDLRISKLLEEAKEVADVLEGIGGEDTVEHEAADLLYHLVVALRGGGSDLAAVMRELRARHGPEPDR